MTVAMAYRVTNSMMINNFNRNLNKNNIKMAHFQSQLATNQKIVRFSDDPVGVIKAMSARSRLASIEQYQSNLSDAKAYLTQAESSMMEVNEIIKRMNELAVNLANEVKTPEDRQAVANEIQEMMKQLITAGNATLGDKYIFGGYNTTKVPFAVDPEGDWVNGVMTFNGLDIEDPANLADINAISDEMQFEVGFNVDMPIAVPGSDVFGRGEDNLYKIVRDFYNAANSPDMEDLAPFIKKFQDAQSNVLSEISQVGGRVNRLELMENRYVQDKINYTQMKSDVEDLDQAEAIMLYSMAEAVYRAALSVGGRTLQPTLVDFLR